MSSSRGVCYGSVCVACLMACLPRGAVDESRPARLLPVDGAAYRATPLDWSDNGHITFEKDGQRQILAPTEFISWGSYADTDRATQVLLSDGSVLVGEVTQVRGDALVIASRLWGELTLPRSAVRGLLFLPATEPWRRDRELKQLAVAGASDRVLLANGDELGGDLLPTTARNEDEGFGLASVTFDLRNTGEAVSLPLEDVHSIALRGTTSALAVARFRCGFHDGSLLVAAEIKPAAAEQLEIVTVSGARWQMDRATFWKDLSFLQPVNNEVTYVADLPDIGYKSLPFLTRTWPLGVNQNVLGGRLRSAGGIFFHGLGMHGTSRVAYPLDGQYRSLEAELALDDRAGRQGSVIYRVLLEAANEQGEQAWKVAYSSPIVRGGDPLLSISVDVRGANRVALVVEFADWGDTLDHANWLHARLLK